jgi:RNA polymerase sigma-70 factor (ECF subfamily)
MDLHHEAPDGRAGSREPATSDDAVRFEELWESYAHRINAYATRHVGPEAAQEIVAETFLVAWRRLKDVPDDALPWLIVVARNTISVARRSERRVHSLEFALVQLSATAAPKAAGPEAIVVEREVMLRGIAALTEIEREALLLTAWDSLGAAQAAIVAGCSMTAFHVRLHRARRRLAGLVDEDEGPPTPSVPEPSPEPTADPIATPRVSWRYP